MNSNKKKTLIGDEIIISKIYFIRDLKIMLDKDLAQLYNVNTRDLNKAVSRNIKRFPNDFMFQLTENEHKNLMFQIGTSSWGGNRKLPYAFTEQGMAMLSGILKSDWAIDVNIRIMRIFSRIRQMSMDNMEFRLAIEEIKKKTENNTKNIELVFHYLDELLEKQENQMPRKQIGFLTSKQETK